MFFLILVLSLILFGVFLLWFVFFADADLTLLYHHAFSSTKDFSGKVIWITGASSGIGEYLAYSLIKRNAKLVLSGTNIGRLQNVQSHCMEISKCAKEDILLVPFSINKFEDHDDCVKEALSHFDHIDILINNAGVSQRADFTDIDIKVDIDLFHVNVFGAIHLTRKVLKHFLERRKGQIVVTSSTAGKIGAPNSSSYTASKHALHGYFEALRSELVGQNIDITLACPGPVFSRITERCVTGKVGETFPHTQQDTDRRMKTERCSELMVTAMANKLDECWISLQPILFVYYLAQYTPSFFRNVVIKKVFNKDLVKKMRQGR